MPQSDDVDEVRRRYEQKTAALIGRRINAVTYWDIHNNSEVPPTWDYRDWHQAVMGVELTTETGPLSVLWTSTFYPYGVEVFPEPISKHLRQGEGGPEGWPVEAHAHWQSRVGTAIQAAKTYWEEVEVGPATRPSDGLRVSDPRTYSIPVALRLDFNAGPVWIVAAMPQWPDVDKVFVGGDELMVVFTPERMREIGFPETEFE